MIKIKDLNNICKNRLVAKDFPAQVVCRLLGNEKDPCKFNSICEKTQKKGMWYFYTIIFSTISFVFLLLFWLLRLTRMSKLAYPVAMFFIVPFEWLATCFAATWQFIRKLPF